MNDKKEAKGGLFRAALAGRGHTLAEAFANLEQAPGIQKLWRHPHQHLLGARIMLDEEEGEGYWELTQIGNDVYVIVENFAYRDPRAELIPGDGMIQFYFKLSGDLTLGVSRTEPLRLNRPSLLVYNQPPGVDLDEWTAPGARERCVAITVRTGYLTDNFIDSSLTTPRNLTSLVSGVPGEFKYRQLPLTVPMFDCAKRLVENPHTGTLGLIYTQALTQELLCMAVAAFGSLTETPTHEFSERDLRCLQKARAVLMKQFAPAPTIRQVARAAGMNDTYLKRSFKAVYGVTLFDFSVRCRMQHALMLLREQRMTVAQVAQAVGYSHQTSFATAFRRHFGMRPKELRTPRRDT
ncbi:MAG: helix-turn-helix transcriptional regulator [Proteobacteria bacterium]|nr:helix-turn-helix transcriptional regulator [Pseudomonadota bacterium]